MSSIQTISPTSLKKLRDSDPHLSVIDVRTPAEFQESHASFAVLTPLETLDPKRVQENAGVGTLYVFCRSGDRATMACQKLIAHGVTNVCVVEGGILAWEAAGLPVVRGHKVISLERQVRIAAGSLVLLGLVLSYMVHPYFIGISAFVGCGLVFAGITNTCGLGILLALMPWNQRSAATNEKSCPQ